MMEHTMNLELLFKNGEGKSATVKIPNPLAGLDRSLTESAMTVIMDSGLFAKDGVDSHAQIVGARYVTRDVEEIFDIA